MMTIGAFVAKYRKALPGVCHNAIALDHILQFSAKNLADAVEDYVRQTGNAQALEDWHEVAQSFPKEVRDEATDGL